MNSSTFLFAEPSFTEGIARVVDLGGALNVYNSSASPEEADWLAIFADWRAVGEDLNDRMVEFPKQQEALVVQAREKKT